MSLIILLSLPRANCFINIWCLCLVLAMPVELSIFSVFVLKACSFWWKKVEIGTTLFSVTISYKNRLVKIACSEYFFLCRSFPFPIRWTSLEMVDRHVIFYWKSAKTTKKRGGVCLRNSVGSGLPEPENPTQTRGISPNLYPKNLKIWKTEPDKTQKFKKLKTRSQRLVKNGQFKTLFKLKTH